MIASANTPPIIAGLDNGLASGALVVLDRSDRERVLAAISLVEPAGAVKAAQAQARQIADRFPGLHDRNFTGVHLRAAAWVQRFAATLDQVELRFGPISVLAVESFDDQAQHAKTMKAGRYKAPVVLGMLAAELTRRELRVTNGRLVYQNAGLALTQWRNELERLKHRQSKNLDMVRPGDRQITNEHQRSAFAHALALSLRLNAAAPCPIAYPAAA